MSRRSEHRDQSAHQINIGGTERSERQVDKLAGWVAALQLRRHSPRFVGGAHRRVEPVPTAAQRSTIGVVGDFGIEVQVERTFLNELEVGERRRATRLHPLVVGGPHVAMRAVVLRAKVAPLTAIVAGVAAEHWWDLGTLHLQRLAADRTHERNAGGNQSRKTVHVVFDDDVRALALNDLLQLRLAVHGAIDQRLPRRLDELAELFDRRQPEHRCGVANEVDPELSGSRFGAVARSRWRREVDEVFDEAQRLQPSLPTRLGGEHDGVPAFAKDVADTNAVVGRPVRAFGHEEKLGHRHFLVDIGRWCGG